MPADRETTPPLTEHNRHIMAEIGFWRGLLREHREADNALGADECEREIAALEKEFDR